ncbi:hypothetical protein ACFLT2_02230 [Acidobacteriota bacterium]
MRKKASNFRTVIFFTVLLCITFSCQQQTERSIDIRIDPALEEKPVTGRLYFLLTDRSDVEPRLVMPFLGAYYFNAPRGSEETGYGLDYCPFFGKDVDALEPGQIATIGEDVLGHPFSTLKDIPPGEYYVQAILHVFTQVTPAHGHTIWLPLDNWEGQQFHLSPGNLISEPKKIHVEDGAPFQVDLALTKKIPPIEPKPDSKYVKRVKIKSKLLSDFWGRDMFLGAHVLLPKGYDEHPEVYYPVLYFRGHFFEKQPFRFPDEEPKAPGEGANRIEQARFQAANYLWAGWMAENTPRFIVVTLQHPTPFYDDSYVVNSPNQGPYDDAILTELIGYVEENFRIIRKSYARVMTGGSTGGWITAAQQIYHPDFFGGAWSFCPDWIDYRNVFGVNMYEDDNMFQPSGFRWLTPERMATRSVEGSPQLTVRQFSQFLAVLGTRGRSGEFIDAYNAAFGPVGEDGYPVQVWNYLTGEISRDQIEYWRDHNFDLRYYLEKNWEELGPKLVGKLHFLCGDMDNFYLNLPVYHMEDFLESTKDPYYGGSFRWGRPKIGHTVIGLGVDPYPFALIKEMATHITKNAPPGENTNQWKYE